MVTRELAEWFGITLKSYLNNRQEKLKELNNFADFDVIYGGVNIKWIYESIYFKKSSEAYQIIKNNFEQAWHKSGLDTAARVGSQIWRENSRLQKLISENTAKQYTCRVRKEFYGLVHKENSSGTKGICKPRWVANNGWEEVTLLTKEQEQQLKQIIKDIYSNEKEPLLYAARRNNEISEEEYQEAINEWNSPVARENRYAAFKQALIDILGFLPDKVTELIKALNF